MKIYFYDKNGEIRFRDQERDADGLISNPEGDRELQEFLQGGGTVSPFSESLDAAKVIQIEHINTSAQNELQLIVSTYPSLEVATWPNQYAEAVAYTANQSATTPTLSAIAATSGQSIAELASAVMVKAAAYMAASGSVIGKRRALTSQVMAIKPTDANAVLAVKAIVW